ncbi:MAG: IclR family transcriptional regulator [Ottowia sp.]|uniref:IclR family transcriptional regulator n=1 Tax=Ottowia sp. TaxID=1898956 RepID=UPI003C70AA96
MIVKQAQQVIELLEFFAQRQRPATLADVTEHFGWPRSSAFNLLTTLAASGYLYEPKPRLGYYPSSRWSVIVDRIRAGEPVPEEVHALLVELAELSGETVALTAASGPNALFIDVVESRHAVRYTAAPGKVVPLHASATGRALLSQRTAAERESMLRKAQFTAYTPNTPMSAAVIEEEIARAGGRGWFIGHAEFSVGLTGVALSLPMDHRAFAILIAGPAERIGDRAEALAKQARAIADRFVAERRAAEKPLD